MNKVSWFNQTQIDYVVAPQKVKVAVCGRAFGKTTMIALMIFLIVKYLPRSKGFLAAKTIEQIEDEILPQIRKKLSSLGLIEKVHYVVGKPPHDWFNKPISPIKNYNHAISFFNGTIIRFLSHARPGGRRGGTYDWGIIDEALEMKEITFDTVFSQLIRGNLYTFDHQLHHNLFILTSRPRKSYAYWIYRFRKLALEQPDKYLFLEASAEDNRAALGDDWFQEQKERLSPFQYATEIENREITALPDGYFYLFDRSKHTYRPTFDSEHRMTDINEDEFFDLSFDFGGKFSCMSVFQEKNGYEYLRRRFFVKNEKKVPALIDEFCQKHQSHTYKYVRLWGEPRGRDSNAMGDDFYTQIQNRFKKHGWASDVMTPSGYKTAEQSVIYDWIEIVLEEEDPSLPRLRINEIACEDTIVAIETADVTPEKGLDKSKEKDSTFPQELATHQPDNIRYYLYLKYVVWSKLQRRSSRIRMS